ncbi:D-isomer specific 2-hydroxyacid dehydrogenase [Hypoxylon rubiginosum]|uniref:D-isomer specific 2-hydroxyacid dehydrogenase n=1 Tax=Hypoxylon rubiginosum TaxID=110542 RepID=A0ACC0D4X6_9PEZI|nr:D-isomer specific 2-hydroxyacid dehydrogenase [Hypoxylon rubiginosum]
MATSQTHHVVVALESFYVPVPQLELPAPHTYELREYERTYPDQVAERIRDADILISTIVPIGAAVLDPSVSPRLKMVAIVASGVDAVDLEACRARGIVVTNTPHCNTVAVAEHAVALYFAARRSLVLSNALVQTGEWPKRGALQKYMNGPDGKPPKTCRDETLGIVGYGAVGRIVESMAKGLGMKVLISGRKGSATAPEGRTPFDVLIRESSVVLLCLPRSPESLNLISDAELASMKPYAVLINVSRGLIVDEKALLAALKNRRIAGYATDVYAQEPASSENNPLVGPDTAGLNLITTPHVAWSAEDTIDKFHKALRANIGGWLSTGQPKYRVA